MAGIIIENRAVASGVVSRPELLSDELLMAFHPLVKLPLPEWVAYILEQVSLDKADQPDYAAISVGFNQVALIEFHFGRAENAFKLCYRHLDWLAELITDTGKLELALQALDPWLNLARLERLVGRYESSLQRLELLANSSAQTELVLGPVRFTSAHWEAITKIKPDVKAFIEYNCLTDMLKTLLKTKNYIAVLNFVENQLLSNTDRALQGILLEAKFMALCQLGQPTEALELAQICSQPETSDPANPVRVSALRRFIFRLHQAEAQAAFNAPEAAKLANRLALAALAFRYDKEPRLLKVVLTLRLVKLLQALGQSGLALELAKQGYNAVSMLRDEPLQVELLGKLVALTNYLNKDEVEQAQWSGLYHQIVSHSCYKNIRAKMLGTNQIVATQEENSIQQHCRTQLDLLFKKLTC